MHNRMPQRKLACLLTLLLAAGCTPPSGGLLIAPGAQAPELVAREWVGGEPTTAGKIVVVDVFATWCVPCAQATPGMIEVYNEFHPQGVEFVALTSEERDEIGKVKQFVSDLGVPWPVGVGAEETLQQFGVKYIPMVFVIGPDGKILSVGDDEPRLRETLGKALAYAAK